MGQNAWVGFGANGTSVRCPRRGIKAAGRRAIANPPRRGGDWSISAHRVRSYGLDIHKAPPFRRRLATPRVGDGTAPLYAARVLSRPIPDSYAGVDVPGPTGPPRSPPSSQKTRQTAPRLAFSRSGTCLSHRRWAAFKSVAAPPIDISAGLSPGWRSGAEPRRSGPVPCRGPDRLSAQGADPAPKLRTRPLPHPGLPASYPCARCQGSTGRLKCNAQSPSGRSHNGPTASALIDLHSLRRLCRRRGLWHRDRQHTVLEIR